MLLKSYRCHTKNYIYQITERDSFMKAFGYTKKNNKFILTFRKKENLPVWLYLKISKEQFEQLMIEYNGEMDLTGRWFFYTKNDIENFINLLKKIS